MPDVQFLILGAGWTSTFLIPLLQARKLSFAATTTTGHSVANSPTIPWKYDPSTTSESDFATLPSAQTILITFPLTGKGQSKFIIESYQHTHNPDKTNPTAATEPRFLQFGSTGIWQIPQETIWLSRRSPYNTSSPRAIAEDELLGLGGCVLNLSGLWGGERDPRNWVGRVAKSKDDVKGKKSLHLIHGKDVARAVLAVAGSAEGWEKARGERWMCTDCFVYDWWALMLGWADAGGEGELDARPSEQARWVVECMREEKVHALPRSMEALGRCYFGREFWDTFELAPLRARV
ncbi:hypothetical protein MBLNU230_g6994t1 [Neophaeotheca triangularis]